MTDIEGSVAVITGGGSGVGRAIALECARQGARGVVIADIESGPAEEAAAEVREAGAAAIAVQTDVSDRAAIEALAARAYEEFGEVNLLFNNAGVSKRNPIAEAPDEDWDWVTSVDLMGPMYGVYAFVPRMREQEGPAHIINTASVSGLVARQNVNGIYTSLKHGLVGVSTVLHDELAPEGIVVSCWCPGGMLTNMSDSGRNRPERFGGPYPQRPRPVAREPNPMTVDDVAKRVLAAVRENRLYIFSHPHTRPTVEAYYQQILDDFEAGERIAAELG